jgi:nucleotide-binding universal stress UspA family protein
VLAAATIDDIRARRAEEADRLTKAARERIAASGLTVETAAREDDPRTVIVDAADDWKVNLIVVGSHSRTGLTRLVLGSVAVCGRSRSLFCRSGARPTP